MGICVAVLAVLCVSSGLPAEAKKYKYANVASASAKGKSKSSTFFGAAFTDTYTDAHAKCEGKDCKSDANANADAEADAYDWWGSYAASQSDSDAHVEIKKGKILDNSAAIDVFPIASGEDAEAKGDADATANGYAYIWKKGGVSPTPPSPPSHPWGKKKKGKWGKKKGW